MSAEVEMRGRVRVPERVVAGEPFEVRTLVSHPMETGYRRDLYGKQIPEDILDRFECRYNGETVFNAEFFRAVAADPFLTFYTVAVESGTLEFRWIGQDEQVYTETVELEVL